MPPFLYDHTTRAIFSAAVFLIVLAACLGTWREHRRKRQLDRIAEAVERQSADAR